MNIKSIAVALKFSVLASLLFSFLFGGKIQRVSSGFFGLMFKKIRSVFIGSPTQWVGVSCLFVCFLVFLFLELRAGYLSSKAVGVGSFEVPESIGKLRKIYYRCHRFFLDPIPWLFALVALVFIRYAVECQTAPSYFRIPVFMTGLVFGRAISAWLRWENSHVEQYTFWALGLVVCLLASSALLQPVGGFAKYHGVVRWTGAWGHPNIYGMLMGMGVVLAFGLGIRQWQIANGAWNKALWTVFCLSAILLMGYGLYKSFSRTAWLGTALGLLYLAIREGMISRFSGYLRCNRLSLMVIIASLTTLIFCQLRFLESLPAQRVSSVVNPNDFSWRNRVTAWKGAIHMMADRPLDGVGWSMAASTSLYQKKYLPPQLGDSDAIQINDFFAVGMSAGVPTLVCLILYFALVFYDKLGGPGSSLSLFTICRAGSLVLLIGFWFSGGFFYLSTAAMFWMLLELSRLEPVLPALVPGVQESVNNPGQNQGWLRRAAWVLAVFAGLQIAVLVGVPFLPVNHGTLALARTFLVLPKETNDFDYLARSPLWQGKRMKNLLEHVGLANYNRQVCNWKLEDSIYREYVLSPTIQPERDGEVHWRRAIWEYYYPTYRKVSDTRVVAQLVLQPLHSRMEVCTNAPLLIEEMWEQKKSSSGGFTALYVATLRSLGIPARIGTNGGSEFFYEKKWQPTPLPVSSF